MPTQPTLNQKSVPNTKPNTADQAESWSLCIMWSGDTKYSLYYINTASETDIRTAATEAKLGIDNTGT